MTTTAFDDQFTPATQTILRVNVIESQQQIHDLQTRLAAAIERAERAEAELAELREQKIVAWKHENGNIFLPWQKDMIITGAVFSPLYAHPIPTPAVPALEIPEGDDFNGTTPHLIQCIEALVGMNDRGVLVPHGIGSHARTLLLASANRLRQQAAPAVPTDAQIHAAYRVALGQSIRERDMPEIRKFAIALLQSTEVKS